LKKTIIKIITTTVHQRQLVRNREKITKTKQNKQQNANKTQQKSPQNQNMIKNLVY